MEYIEKISNETGFVKSTLEKVERLLDILKWINGNEKLNKMLALKGGTAINTAVFDFPRLSVDIDMDLILNLSKDEMLKEKENIHTLIVKYLQSNDYTISDKKSKITYALDSIVAEYKDIIGNIDNIKIEINYMNRVHILETKQLDIATHVFKDKQFKIRCVHPIEIYASKICALLSRAAARDLFDVYTLSKSELFTEKEKQLLKQCFMLEYIAVNGYSLDDMDVEKIEKINKRDIKMKLLQTLRDRNPKKCNVEEMKNAVKKYLKEILVMDDSAILFYNKFQEGIYDPKLLFEDKEIAERVKEHPMIMWKLNNK